MSKKNIKLKWGGLAAAIVAIAAGITGATINLNIENGKINANIIYSQEEIPALVEGDRGEIYETTTIDGEEIPTVEEVDGGMFKDKDTGVSVTTTNGQYSDLGWSEWYPTDTPEAFKNATLGHCIYANNYWGAQCVSLSRVFWWSYADRDVSTCGTGMAKGMMDCADENAGDDFEVHWGIAGVQSGDWIIWGTGQYGHVAMALGPQSGNYVTVLGENQGGRPCEGGGAATNIINLNVNGVIGYYRPKSYIKPVPTPEPTPTPTPEPTPVVDTCKTRTVIKGDTLGKIMEECRGEIVWGEAMNEYARHWYSTIINPGNTVFYGWTHGTGYGLFYDDVIEYRD